MEKFSAAYRNGRVPGGAPLSTQLEEFLPSITTADSRILDLGCGTGRTARYLLDKFRSNGLEPFYVCCDILNVFPGGKGLHFLRADAFSLPFRSKCFDIVLIRHATEGYSNEALKSLGSECSRVCRRPAWLLLEFMLDTREHAVSGAKLIADTVGAFSSFETVSVSIYRHHGSRWTSGRLCVDVISTSK